MSEERWQVTGSAAEVYQRQLVPAIFAPWAPPGPRPRRPGDRRAPPGHGLRHRGRGPAAVAELARVLAPGGRLTAMVWRSIDHSQGFAALADALDRSIGADAGAIMRAPFALNDEEALADLLAGGGFDDVEVRPEAGTVRFSSIQEFVLAQGTGSPLADPSAPPAPPPGPPCSPTPRPPWPHSRAPTRSPSRSRPSCSAGVFPDHGQGQPRHASQPPPRWRSVRSPWVRGRSPAGQRR
jgi:hypothetical protein